MKRRPDHVLEIVTGPVFMHGAPMVAVIQRPARLQDMPPGMALEWLQTANWEPLYRVNVYLKQEAR